MCGGGVGLGGVAGVAYFITGHEQTQLSRISYFHFFAVFLAPKGPYCLEHISSLQLTVPCGALKCLPVYHRAIQNLF